MCYFVAKNIYKTPGQKWIILSTILLLLFSACTTYRTPDAFSDSPSAKPSVIEKDNKPTPKAMHSKSAIADELPPAIDDAQKLSPTAIDNSPLPQIANPTLTPGDTIYIEVKGDDELTGKFVIPDDGIIYYPLLEQIKVEGKTVKQLATELKTKLSEYLVVPIINVSVLEWGKRNVYVYGSSKGAVAVPLSPNVVTPASRLLMSVGIPDDTDLSRIYLVRHKPGQEKQIIHLPMHEILENYALEKDVILQAGDLLVIKKNPQVYLQGSVAKAGTYPILEKEMSLWTLLSLANGTTSNADLQNIQIIRLGENNQRETMTVSIVEGGAEKILLQPDDVVVVPSKEAENFVTIYGEIQKPGIVKLMGAQVRLSTVIALAGGLTKYASNTIQIFRYAPSGNKKYLLDFKAITSGDTEHDIAMQPGDVIFIDSSLW